MNIINTILKGLSTLAGPAGAPIEMYLYAANEVEGTFKHNQIIEILNSNNDITKDSINEIFKLREGLKETNNQLIIGINALRKILNKKILSNKNPAKSIGDLEITICDNEKQIRNEGYITQELLYIHLLEYYKNDINRFLRLISFAGFDLSDIPQKVAPSEVIYTFLDLLKGKNNELKYNVFRKLSKDKDGDNTLLKICKMYEEMINIE